MGLFRPLSDIKAEALEWASSAHPRVGTGYSFFDKRTNGGIAEGEVALFIARSSVGKTAFAVNVCENNRDVPTVFMSLEMHARFVLQRLTAVHLGMSTRKVEDLARAGDDRPLQQTVEEFPLLGIADRPAMGFKEMGIALNEAAEHTGEKPRLVVVDFMELIGGVASLEAVGQVDKTARKAKDFAREHDIALLMLHQVGRGSGQEGHLPLSMNSGRFGGEVSADYMLGAYRPCLEPGIGQQEYMRLRDQYMLQFLKTRGGSEIHPSGVRHYYEPESMRITEIIQGVPVTPAAMVTPRTWENYELELAGVGPQ
jgi:replicative DNA helicase